MKKAALVIGLLICVAAPLFAQGPFADVPTDHWAYEAVNQLQQDGILIGYPDGTFGGKRAMTRYEFAVAIARMIPIIRQPGAEGVSQADFNALQNRVTALENRPTPQAPDLSAYAKTADVEALRRLVDEFRDELAALGVDVDALKRDVAALNDRVCALEKEMARIKWFGAVDVIGTAGDLSTGTAAFDLDDRGITSDDLVNNISALENVDLNFRAGLTDTAVANVKTIGGNYLSWIGTVDDYSVFTRPDSKATGLTTKAALYYAYVDWALGNGKMSVGRQPVQWSPYTLKMIDVDSYGAINYTDSGDYPMDAARLVYRLGGVRLDAFAGKNNEHELLLNGLTSQPTSGLYNDVLASDFPGVTGLPASNPGAFNVLGGHAAGGLATIDQSAGVRLGIGTPFHGNLNGSWMQAAGPAVAVAGLGPGGTIGTFDSVNVFGADLNFNISSFNIVGQWAQSDTLGTGATDDITDDNQAIDAKIGIGFGKLGIDGGWKRVDRNFTAPGFWDKLGRWTNPTNIEGWYADLNWGLTSNISLVAKAAFYSARDNFVGALPSVMDDTGDDVNYYTAGLKWGFSPANTVTLGAELVSWDPDDAGTTDELYWNIGWGYQINPSAGFRLLYQIVDYDGVNAGASPYGNADYKGNVAFAQFGVKF